MRHTSARILFSSIPLVVLALLAAGCEGDKETITNTQTVDKFPVCSPTYPLGTCDAGMSCLAGACVNTATLCSSTNLTGACADGEACFQGSCLPGTLLCGAANPTGLCDPGKVCMERACVDATTLCSAGNPTGTCADGETCLEGTCLPAILMCGTTNLAGLCGPGKVCTNGACVDPPAVIVACGPASPTGACPDTLTCLGGVCIATDALCTATNPTGTCIVGRTCLEGTCVATASLCSGVNPAGTCPADHECKNGVCVEPTVPFDPCATPVYATQPVIEAHTSVSGKAVLTVDGLMFKDLDGDGALTPYEDWRLLEICRAENLVSLMTLAQKIGTMNESGSVGSGTADGTIPANVTATIVDQNRRFALIRLGQRTATELATYLNNLQELAETQPLGIPVTLTTDPAHATTQSTNAQTGAQTLGAPTVVTPWPTPLGLGAINDRTLTRQHCDMVRQEFMAMGFRWQLGPQIDLGTEPRWARTQSLFGENALHVSAHAAACVAAFQGAGNGGLKNGIAATMKHFPGAGPDEDGKDSHSRPGRFNVFPGNYFQYHLLPFQAAIDVGVAAVMPCYSIFLNQFEYSPEQVAAGFSHGLITTLLKEKMGFTGMVTGDWGTLGHAYNAESVPIEQRAAMWVQAGSTQFGNDSETNFLNAYNAGWLTEAEIDRAVVKNVEMAFKLGLFEDPYVDPAAAATTVRSAANRKAGFDAQKKAIVMLRNRAHEFPPVVSGGFGPPPADPAPKYLPIDGSRFTDANENSTPDPGEYIDDTNGDGTIRVWFDGVVDGLVEGAETPDPVTDVVGEYDYTKAGTATSLPIAQADSLATADIAVLRITSRKGVYFGSDAGYPLSFDGPFQGTATDGTIGPSIVDRNRVIDALRVRDGYTDAAGTAVAATNPDLKIVVVMHMDRPGIVDPFIKGLVTLDELAGQPGSYPLVSDPANTDPTGLAGIDGFLVDFGAYDRAVLDFLFNVNPIDGWTYGKARLPMEIPSSDAAVEAQFEDVPADSRNPTFLLGAGMGY